MNREIDVEIFCHILVRIEAKEYKDGKMILTGDIGGTNTRLALWENKNLCKREKKYPSTQYPNLYSILTHFLQGEKISAACFGVAGPVKNGVSRITNLPWTIDAKDLSRKLHLQHVHLLNDLEAHAYGINYLSSQEIHILQEGKESLGSRALIAAGTGLGEAGIYWDGKEHRPFASEGGHADFGPRNDLEIELLLFLRERYSHVSYERILSGSGILLLYEFFLSKGKKEHPEIQGEFQKRDPAEVISEYAQKKKCPLCEDAVYLFCSIYGAEAGNLALKMLPWNGLYIGGGIAPKVFAFVKKEIFLDSFLDKGRFRDILLNIPVKLILNDKTSLLGCLDYAEKDLC